MSDMINKKLQVAAYARVSTDKEDQLNSFESQIKYFTDYIEKQKNWEIVEVYCDEGVTGTTRKNRIGFNRMLNDAFLGKIDLIITKEVSRFARNTVDTLQITRELKTNNIGVFFILDNINTMDKDGELRLTLMASLAQEESRKTSERVKWGQKRQMEKGVVFGRSLLGYKVENGKLYLNKEEADIVKLIFHKYLNENKGTHIIARELNENGVIINDCEGKLNYKNKWSATAILRILRNEKYVGDLVQKKTWTQNYLDHKKRYNRGEEELIYIKDHHTDIAIISREMWNATQAELLRRTLTAKEKSKYSNRYWASGKIQCGICGEKFVIRKKGAASSWCCLNRVKAIDFRSNNCDMSEYISDRSLKDIISSILNELIVNKNELKNDVVKSVSELNSEKTIPSTDEIQQKIKKLEQMKSKLIDLRITDEISKEDFKNKKLEIEENISFLHLELDKPPTSLSQTRREIIDAISSETERILTFEDRNIDSLLKTVIEKISIFKGHIVVIKFVDIPVNFKVFYSSKGRLNTYSTEILNLDIVHD